MYNCGPTVYNYAHVGNLRSYVFADTLRRMFEWNDYTIKQVINITDVGHLTSDANDGDDKVEKEAQKEGKTAQEITTFYTQAFFDDLDALNIPRTHITFPKATDYISEQIAMIQSLVDGGYTYNTNDGIYFDTSKFPEYGKLGNIDLSGLREGARIGVQDERKHPTDFVLWKKSNLNEKRQQEWQSPWGIGFPGWHIECSAMSKKLLGETFDIHTGGIDHIPVHHNNEIAQSVCANHQPFVHYWMHNAFLTIGDEDKMSKSSGNFIRLDTLRERGINALAYRYLLLSARYSSPLQFSWEALTGAQIAWKKLCARATDDISVTDSEPAIIEKYTQMFSGFIADDLDTPKALALVWEMLRDTDVTPFDGQTLLRKFDTVLGLGLSTQEKIKIPYNIEQLVAERDLARINKDFAESDRLRAEIESNGFIVSDTVEGTRVSKK